jgi:hypothetical protein
MKHALLMIPLLFSFFHSAYALDIPSDASANLDLSSPNGSVVDRIAANNAKQTMAAEYYRVLEMSKEAVFFEFHFGLFEDSYLGEVIPGYASNAPALTTTSLGVTGAWLFKLNLSGPKYPYSGRILSKIEYIRELGAQYGLSLDPKSLGQLEGIRSRMDEYRSKTMSRRFSAGIGLPVYFQVQSPAFAMNGVFPDDIFIFAGYDLLDTAAIEVGANFFLNRIFLGLSVDLSTPSYQLANAFAGVIRSLFSPRTLFPTASYID